MDSDKAKESAMVLLHSLAGHAAGARRWTMVVDLEMDQQGALPSTGCCIKMHGLLVLDGTQLVDAFPQLSPPTKRTLLFRVFLSVRVIRCE